MIVMVFFCLYAVPFMEAGGLEHFAELLQRFPNNIHVLLEIAKVVNSPKQSNFIQSQKCTYIVAMVDLLDRLNCDKRVKLNGSDVLLLCLWKRLSLVMILYHVYSSKWLRS